MLEKYQSDPDLIGFLGWVYKCWTPQRYTDAQHNFLRAYQLKNTNSELYLHWARMEADHLEWTKSANAAENGLKMIPGNCSLHKAAGYARGRLAVDLSRALQEDRAVREFRESTGHYLKALRDPADLPPRERKINADAYRGLALNYHSLGDIDRMREVFSRWRKEHPDDPRVEQEWVRLSRKIE
jgi:tetratricopeptide (TPR) repeat protein